jgi:Ca-activated chloride channel homolog
MRQRMVPALSKSAARVAAVLFVVSALASSLVPASLARQTAARPRRAIPTSAARRSQAQQPTPTPTPARTTTTNAAQSSQTPTPTPSTQTQNPAGQRPKLQTQPQVDPNAPQQQGDTEQEVDPEELITIESNETILHVRVIDRNNHPVNDVRQDEFHVYENNVPQTITSIRSEEVPITYGLVVDNSGSLRNQIGQVIEAGKSIVSSNKQGDETFVVRFVSSDEIKIMQDFTADRQSLNDALEDMYVEGGQTAVIDAVYLAAEHASERRKGDPVEDKRRRALILVTDGEDRASFYNQEKLFEALKEEDVQIFVIGFVNELDKDRGFITKSKRDKAVALLDKMAKETGGRAFYPASLSELPDIAAQITKDLRTQYVISYKPTSPARPGEFRPVRVAVADAPGRDKRIAVTRSGYTAKGAPQQQQNAPRPNNAPAPARRQ